MGENSTIIRLLSAVVLAAFAAGGFAAAPRADTRPPALSLEPRAERITRLLSEWTVRSTPPSSAPCRLLPISEETARIAPTYTSPASLHPGAEIDLTIARWHTAGLARSVTERVGEAKEFDCIRAHQQARYKRTYHRTVTIRFDPHLPTWVHPNQGQLLHGYTQTIHVPGYKTSLVYVEVAFIDKSDPRVSWSIGFFDYGQATLVPLFRTILAAAESAQHTI
jgi:hypothetical protein